MSGSAYFNDGRFEEAAREFQEAFDLSGRPEMLLNLSHAHDKGGHLDQAIADLELLLNRYPKTALRPDVERELADLRARKQAQDEAAGQAAAAGPVEPEQSVGQSATEPVQAAEPTPKAEAKEHRRGIRIGLPTWIAAGGALALGAVAVATGVVAHNKHSDLESSCKPNDCAASNADKASSGKTLALVSTITTFAAVGAAAAAVTMFFLEVGVPKERAVAMAPIVSPSQLGAAARVTF